MTTSTSVRKSKKYRELQALMKEPSARRQRGGTLAWVEDHKESALLEALLADHAKRHGQGQGISHDEFIQRVLEPKFGYPYEVSALRSYLVRRYGQRGKKRGS